MKKLSIAITLLLILSSKAFAQYEFEYVFDSIKNESTCVLFNDIIELDNGDFFILGTDLAKAKAKYFCRFSSSGELINEKRINYNELTPPDYYGLGHDDCRILTKDGGGFYIFYACNPVLNPSLLGHDPNTFDAKLVMCEVDADFDIINSKEMTISIDTIDWQNTQTSNSYHSRIIVGTVMENKGEGFVISYEKLITHNPYSTHTPGHGDDSTFFLKTDYDLNVLKEGCFARVMCNKIRHKNHLLYDEELDTYLYYSSYEWQGSDSEGFHVAQFDSDFNLIKDNIMPGTIGTGYRVIYYRDSDATVDGITLKRTSSHTTIFGAAALFAFPTYMYTIASCVEVDDNAQRVDSMMFAHSEYASNNRTLVPNGCCMDWIDEDKIFIGAIPEGYVFSLTGLPPKYSKNLILRRLNRNLNTMDELYYNKGIDSTSLYISTLKATRDGGCIIAGYFRDYFENPNDNFPRAFHSLVKKFPPEAFNGIDEAHDNGLNVAFAYPNPGNNVLNIRTALPNSHVEVYDINGKLICNQDITDIITSIKTDSWPLGIYVWKVFSDKQEAETGKWVKDTEY